MELSNSSQSNSSRRLAFLLIFFSLLVSTPIWAQDSRNHIDDKTIKDHGRFDGLKTPLKVVVTGSAPFVLPANIEGPPKGLSIDVWSAIAEKLSLRFELLRSKNVAQAIQWVTAGKADVAVGPISITATRAQQVDFTQPYFNSSLAILAPPTKSLLHKVKPFMTKAFLSGVLVLIVILVMVGTIIWLVERRKNQEHFSKNPLSGVGSGIWMALVTMTTVGYGDKVPKTVAGRVVTGIWMTLSLIIASSITAFLATALTLSQLDDTTMTSTDDLRGKRVGVVKETTSEDFAKSHGARRVPADTVKEAISLLNQGKLDAVVFDRPILRYLLAQHPEWDLIVSEASYNHQGYGFATRLDSNLRQILDVELLRLSESGELASIVSRWLDR